MGVLLIECESQCANQIIEFEYGFQVVEKARHCGIEKVFIRIRKSVNYLEDFGLLDATLLLQPIQLIETVQGMPYIVLVN